MRREIDVRSRIVPALRLALPRLADLPQRGWWGGDLHVHMNYGGAYRNTPAHLALQARAEGLHVVENLIVNKEQRIPDIAYWRPDADPVSTADFILAHGQEYHTSFWGHIGMLGLREHYLLPDYAGYPADRPREPLSDERDRGRHRPRAGCAHGLRAPLRLPAGPHDSGRSRRTSCRSTSRMERWTTSR